MFKTIKKFLVGTVLGAIFGVLAFTAFPTLAYIQVPNTSLSLNSLLVSGTAPYIASGFGYSASTVLATANGTGAFEIPISSVAASSGVLTMPNATNGWACQVFGETTNASSVLVKQIASSASSVTIANYNNSLAQGNFAVVTVFHASCFGY